VTDKRAYFKLDVGYLSNPKISALLDEHPRAILLHLECIAYATQHLTDGVVPMRLAMRLACSMQCDLDLLLQCGLLVDIGGGNVEVHDYLEHQRSAADVKTASDKGKRAAAARWEDAQGNASSNASSMPNALLNPMPRERERNKEHTTREFEDFYEAYPRKVGKGQAVKAWRAAVKKTSAEKITAAASSFASLTKNTEQRFIPYPATWLNGERWADDLNADPPEPTNDDWMYSV